MFFLSKSWHDFNVFSTPSPPLKICPKPLETRGTVVHYLVIYSLLQIFKNPNIDGDTAISKVARLMGHSVHSFLYEVKPVKKLR